MRELKLSQLESALVSRHYEAARTLDPVSELLGQEASVLEAEISEDQRGLDFKRQRLVRLREAQSECVIRLQRTRDELRGLVSRVVSKETGISEQDVDANAYGFSVTPNGTVTALTEGKNT